MNEDQMHTIILLVVIFSAFSVCAGLFEATPSERDGCPVVTVMYDGDGGKDIDKGEKVLLEEGTGPLTANDTYWFECDNGTNLVPENAPNKHVIYDHVDNSTIRHVN